MDKKLLAILVCPLCKGGLIHLKKRSELVCRFGRVAFPIRDGIPVMIESETRLLTLEELDQMKPQ